MSQTIDLKVEYTNRMAQENEALRAQVELLKEAINTALRGTVFDEVGNRDDNGLIPYGKTETAIRVLVDALCSLSESQAAKGGE